ncbi:uncharacterized membrane-anchored protein YjiN (DUF445 family) [Algoriphagus ratkowskyi]|uniref:DUF445 domain-containing protein n=1 Tax=Algoriphagus ratkowskyi TaxID=57028 RepID=A0A2W7RYF2_9BACT|nr:DUF445 domain-containing protein [Algoriphagus ratkowskyi]PZX55935.1 uncharacterized membrane-anchored protein YjiN (DUF445 family) [Algoriphagus ratkowskyi]TXD77251.1 DUF445 domain-containing protein [Algoriphagus ratkowskyi]
MKNRIGTISLAVALIGLVFFELMLRGGHLSHQGWKVVLAGFEAAAIGGFADWFAVSALFREIPIPYFKRHTNIIAKNRDKLTEGIVDLVTNQWLSPVVISEKISEINPTHTIISFLKKPHNQQKTIAVVKRIVVKLADEVDNPKMASALKSILNEQIHELDLTSTLAKWLEKSIKNGDHHQLWELVIEASSTAISSPDTRKLLLSKLEYAAAEYGHKSLVKRLTISIGKSVGGIDLDVLAEELLRNAEEFLTEAKANPTHPIRSKFDEWMLDFAQKVASGDGDSRKMIADFIQGLTQHSDAEKIIQNLLTGFKETIRQQLKHDETPLMQFVISKLNKVILEMETDLEVQNKINHWIKDTVSQLITQFHGEIGNMVRNSLSKLDNEELVAQIEDKVGSDLQYIRLNGAVVGGLVGIIIALIRLI